MDYMAAQMNRATHFLIVMFFSISLFGLTFLLPRTDCRLWQENPKPKTTVSYVQLRKDSKEFLGNTTFPDYFRLLERDGLSILVGARNVVYNISLSDFRENLNRRIEWYSSEETIKTCTVKGNNDEECQNYIRILMKKSQRELLVCGTNAFNPKCRRYGLNGIENQFTQETETPAVAICPYDPRHNSTALHVDGNLYVGTVADRISKEPLIARDDGLQNIITTPQTMSYLNDPSFVGSLDSDSYVYFFFRETAEEFRNCGKTVYSRVARVCKNDRGGRGPLLQKWTSFLKTRLECSVPGDTSFYFDEIQAVSAPTDGIYKGSQNKVVYGVFSTQTNSIPGSAICAFSLSDIDRSFEKSRFKEQKSDFNNLQAVPPNEVPEPRPGQCVNDSLTLTDKMYSFIKAHTMMNDAVPSLYGRPLIVYTSITSRYTTVAVAPQVRTVDDRHHDVLYIGTNDGRVIKSINLDLDAKTSEEPVIIEEIQVNIGRPVTNLQVVEDRLIVVFDDKISSLPLHRCNLVGTCRECVELRDPHCAWMGSECKYQDTTTRNMISKNAMGPIQDVRTGKSDRCPIESSSFATSNTVSDASVNANCRPCITQCPACSPRDSHSRQPNVISAIMPAITGIEKPHARPKQDIDNEVPEYQTSNVELGNVYREETLAVAVVMTLLLSLLAGFAIGYLVSRYRNSAFKESNLSEGSDYSYTHRPGVDSRTEPIYAPPEFPPTKAINVVLNMQRNTLKNLSTTTMDHKPNPPSKKVYL